MPKYLSNFFSLPSTSLGRWSAWLLVLSFALILASNLVEQTQSNDDTIDSLLNLTAFLFVIATGAMGLLTILIKNERSWTAFLAVALLLFVLAMNLGTLLGE